MDETEQSDLPTPALANDAPVSVREAAKQLGAWRAKQVQPEPPAPEPKAAVVRQEESRQEETPVEDVAPPDAEAPDESTIEESDPADLPPLSRPRSWPKEHNERWSQLDRDTQELLLERDRQDHAALRRAQNEASERSKTLAAKEQAAEEQRQRYEQAVANTLETLTAKSEFADIKTPQDIQNLAENDPFRYVKWQAHQDSVRQLNAENERLRTERVQESQKRFETWADEQDKTFISKSKDFADPKKAAEIREKVILPYLTDSVGIEPETLTRLWHEPIFRAAEMQRIIYDAARFNAARENAKAITAVVKPPPQRPGVAQGKGAQALSAIEQAQKRLENARGMDASRAAVDLLRAKRAASRR